MKKLSFNIIGAGSMGHLWASFLSRTGCKVKLYARTQRQEVTYKVQSPLGNFTQTIQYSTLSDWQDADITLICVKAYHLKALCLELKQIMTSSRLILIMNGMGLVEIVRQYLPKLDVYHASIVHGVYIQDNLIIHTGKGETVLGDISSINAVTKDDSLIDQLNQALPKVFWNENHQQAMYLKLIVNAVINPITTLNNQPNQSILFNDKLTKQAENLLSELKPLLAIILPEFEYAFIKQKIEEVAFNTQSNISSMLQDVRAKKATEIDFINGYLVELAKSIRLELPLNNQIIRKIKSLSQGY